MSLLRCHNVLVTAALVLSAGWVIAWAGGLLADSGSWVVRFGLLSASLVLAGGSVALCLRYYERDNREFERYVETLCRIDLRDLHSDKTTGDVAPLRANNMWCQLADRIRETFLQQCRQIQELEHTQAGSDIRCHRATAQLEHIKAIFSGLGDPILAINEYDELVLANSSAEELFQFDIQNAETRALAQLVHCQKLTNLLTTTCHRKTHSTRTDEIEIPDEHGNSRWYRATASKLAAATGETDSPEPSRPHEGADAAAMGNCNAVAVLHDIGDRKALHKRNAEFVSAVSHEMKTPLAGIKAYVELLADGDAEDEETQEEFLEVINGQADRLQRLVDNMLNLARIEAGVVNVGKQTQSLNELLEEAAGVVRPSAEAKQINLVTDLSPMYLGVFVDRDMLLQAAINLLSNAVKYTPKQGRVTLRSRLENEHVRFEVEDTGVGLSEEDSQRVFDKFYRVNKDKNMASGTGLGLPLAKHIVEDVHGGRLTAESTLGEGSTFVVTVPGTGKLP